MMNIAYAKEKYLRISPLKVRRIAYQIVNKNVIDAEAYLSVMPNKGALALKKAIHSARTNYMRINQEADEADLIVSKILVDACSTFKRFRPVGRGRSARILKRNCQIYVEVSVKGGNNGPES
jgi:large subunit ribosomal protein L22